MTVELQAPPGSYYYYSPVFLEQLASRNANSYTTLALYVGKPGKGKSWAGLKTCERLDPDFTVDQVVFNGRQFKRAVEHSKRNSWHMWDEPNKGLSHLEFYTEISKAVATYLQTSRFRGKNVVFALPLSRLINKNARAVITFEAVFWNRGICTVYELQPNHFGSSPEIFKNKLYEAEFRPPSHELVRAYEDKREEWHKKEFPDEPFIDDFAPIERAGKNKSFETVLANVKKNLEKYAYPSGHQRAGELAITKIMGIEGCSDQLARKVKERIIDDQAKRAVNQ